jgi:hypothetical protein
MHITKALVRASHFATVSGFFAADSTKAILGGPSLAIRHSEFFVHETSARS